MSTGGKVFLTFLIGVGGLALTIVGYNLHILWMMIAGSSVIFVSALFLIVVSGIVVIRVRDNDKRTDSRDASGHHWRF